MNRHEVIEIHPHAVRSVIMSWVLSCSMFFALGFGARPILVAAWNRYMDVPPVTVACVPEPKPTLTWGKRGAN